MERSKTQEFTARVAGASRTELIVIIYDIILEDIGSAKQEKDRNLLRHELQHAARFVNELMKSLNFEYAISLELWSIYEYVSRILNTTAFSGEIEKLADVEDILAMLREAFIEVAKQDESGPVMANTQQITAGLTYGKNSLNEVMLENENRGYLA